MSLRIDDIERDRNGQVTVSFTLDDRRGARWLAITIPPQTTLDEAVQLMRDHWRKEMSA